jgi:hypothetical protein
LDLFGPIGAGPRAALIASKWNTRADDQPQDQLASLPFGLHAGRRTTSRAGRAECLARSRVSLRVGRFSVVHGDFAAALVRRVPRAERLTGTGVANLRAGERRIRLQQQQVTFSKHSASSVACATTTVTAANPTARDTGVRSRATRGPSNPNSARGRTAESTPGGWCAGRTGRATPSNSR